MARIALPETLRARVAVLSSAIMLVALVFMLWLMATLFSAGMREGTDQSLQADLEIVRSLITIGAGGRVELFGFPEPHQPLDNALRHVRFQVQDENGRVMLHSQGLEDTPLPWPKQGAPDHEHSYDAKFRDEGVRIRAAPFLLSENGSSIRVRLQTVRSIEPFLLQENRLHFLMWMLAPVPVLLVGLGSLGAAHVALLPLQQISRQVTEMGPANLRPLPQTNAVDEVGRLSHGFNALLDRLERALNQLRQFTADASHELRTPLAALRARGEVALSQMRDPTAYRATIADMLDESARLEQLLAALLQLARADAGMVKTDMRPIKLADALRDWAEPLEPLATEKSIALHFDAGHPVSIVADALLLERAVTNLLANAIRYTPEQGSILLRQWTDNNTVHIEVRDTGPGIPPSERERVFERFVQLDPARTRKSGFGLGLAIARWAVGLHGGTLALEANEPTGTCAHICLPLA